jgi:hypothetical protein
MYEDQSLITVLLSNDPFFGDPGITVPANLLSLSFNYSFEEGIDNDDNFYAKVFDGDTGIILNDFGLDFSEAGIITWDLSGINSSITKLGPEFQLNANPGDLSLDSFVDISNVHLETAATPVPEPGTLILLGSGLVGLLGIGRKKFLHIF